jgi:hypothetical protein
MRYRSKNDFQVTVSELCPKCNTLQSEVKERRQYVYTQGWVEQTSCQACFDQALKAANDKKVESDNWHGFFG